MAPIPADPKLRFARFVKYGDGCWTWTGCVTPTGYGRFRVGGRGGRSVPSHRFAYEMANGPIDPGMVVRHACDNRACVNPAHLEVGTQAENLADMVDRGRDRKARGERAGKSKLTTTDVREIRRLAATGLSNPEIGQRFGVHAASIWSILHRHHWAHVRD